MPSITIHKRISAILSAGIVAVLLLTSAVFSQNFTFLHVSDEHSGAGGGTVDTINNMSTLSSIYLEPYKVTASKPAFAIETGDMTEFGPIDGTYNRIVELYKSGNLVHYQSLGNHDGAWRSLSPELTKEYGAPYYSFDKFGCHFIVLNSAGIEDPSPVIGADQLNWLKSDLKKTGVKVPVFLAFHHPLDCTEYSGQYQIDQICDILRPYNIALIMVGHGHSSRYSKYDGFDMVEGGSAYGPGKPGFNVISVLNDTLRVAYKETSLSWATVPLLEKPFIRAEQSCPQIKIKSPVEQKSYQSDIPIQAETGLKSGNITSCKLELDGKAYSDLAAKTGGLFEGSLSISELEAGAHYIKVSFTNANGAIYHQSRSFYVNKDNIKVLWRKPVGSVTRSRPVFASGKIFIGTLDGRLISLAAENGRLIWTYKTGYAFAGDPLVIGKNVYAGSSDGNLYCLDADNGKLIWKFSANEPIFSSAVSDGENIYFGSSTGAFYSISLSSGKLNWKNTDATYNIDIKPFIIDGKVYYGCWDTYLYCLNTNDGSLAWKCVGKGSSEGLAPRYYSPADCGPVVCRGKVFAADRKYRLSLIDIATGQITNTLNNVSAVSLSQDGNYVYLRGNDGILTKIDSEANKVWSTNVSMDWAPIPPVESDGSVYVCSKKGYFSIVSADTGNIVKSYKLTPGLFVLSPVGVSDKAVYLCGSDGMLTAIER